MLMLSRRGLLFGAILIVGLLLLACGGDEEENGGEATKPAETGGPETEQVQGVTDTEIILGTHYPMSNSPAAVYANSAYAMEAYFDSINDQGGVNGRKITFVIEDDQYAPSLAVEAVRRLVEQKKVFAIANGLGDPGHYSVFKYLEEKGIPDLFLGGGIPAFSDPPGKLRFVSIPSYDTEVKAELAYLQEHYSGKKIALLVQNDEAGRGSEEVFRENLEESGIDIEIVGAEYYDFTESVMTAQAQRLKATNPDLVVFMSAPAQAANFAKSARELLNWDVPFICGLVAGGDFYIALAGPEAAEGTIGMTYGPYLYTPGAGEGYQPLRDGMAKYKPEVPINSQTTYGWGVAELIVKALQNAGRDLTPESVAKGAESIKDWCCAACFAPVTLSPDDHRPQELIVFVQVKDGKWEFTGEWASIETTPGAQKICPFFEEIVPNTKELTVPQG